MNDLRYPIGQFTYKRPITEEMIDTWIQEIEDLEKTFNHPETGETKLAVAIGLYAWHGRHHTAHITSLRKRLNW